jgi:hypothetical protein
MPTVVFPPSSAALTFLWQVLFDLADEMPSEWCLVGGQLVALHALEHGRTDVRAGADAGIVVDVRADPTAAERLSGLLMARSFEPGPRLDGLLQRLICKAGRDAIVVDLLAPGSQAIERTEIIAVKVDGRVGRIPRPSLLGAVLTEAAALDVQDDPHRHEFDLALLLSLVRDPLVLRQRLTASERTALRSCALADRRHRAWRTLTDSEADSGHAALRTLGGA